MQLYVVEFDLHPNEKRVSSLMSYLGHAATAQL